MSANASGQFQLVNEKGWRRGLGNLLQGEYSAWFKSSRWWKHLILWFSIINLMIIFTILGSAKAAQEVQEVPPILLLHGIFGGMFVALGVMIIMQRVLIGEIRSGTAAWVLSKPVTRTAFVISRLAVNSVAILLTSVIVPGAIFYMTLGLFSSFGWLPPFGFMGALLMISLHTFFWITLVLMMGTLFESSAAVIALLMVLFFILWMGTSKIQALIYTPVLLIFSPKPEQMSVLSVSFMTGEPVLSWLPLISTVIYCAIFIAVANWRFNGHEF